MASKDSKQKSEVSGKPAEGKAAATKAKAAGAEKEPVTPEVEEAGTGEPEDRGAEANAESTGIKPEDIIEDPEFKNVLPPHSEDEHNNLEQDILEHECLHGVVVWKGHRRLVDGYRRRAICNRHGKTYPIKELEFPDREAVKAWIRKHAAGTRQMTEVRKSYSRGKQFNELVKEQQKKSKQDGSPVSLKSIAKRLGDEWGVHERTIQRDGKFAKRIDILAANCGDEIFRATLAGKVKLTEADLREMMDLTPDEQRELVPEILEKRKWEKPKPEKVAATEQALNACTQVKDHEALDTLRKLLEQPKYANALATIQGGVTNDGGEEGASKEEESKDTEAE